MLDQTVKHPLCVKSKICKCSHFKVCSFGGAFEEPSFGEGLVQLSQKWILTEIGCDSFFLLHTQNTWTVRKTSELPSLCISHTDRHENMHNRCTGLQQRRLEKMKCRCSVKVGLYSARVTSIQKLYQCLLWESYMYSDSGCACGCLCLRMAENNVYVHSL